VLEPIATSGTPAQALAALNDARRGGHPFDLVISYWGRVYPPATVTPGAELLMGMRARDLRCPVLIFAGMHDADQRKREALSLGAQAYCYEFETLFRRIEDIFSSARSTW
jgi:DNA-binding NarL/FixJ family response regulator